MIRILRAVDSRLGGNLLFMILMAFGAVLSLARGFGAAVILPAAEFGLYALLVAVAAFVSSIAGFGKIEETRKLFPRMAVDGHGADIAPMADRLALLVGLRLTLIATPLCFAGTFLLSHAWAAAIFATFLLIFGVAWSTILASALRASSNLNVMGLSAAARAIITIVLALAGSYEFGFAGGVSGEAAGALIGSIIMRHFLKKKVFSNAHRSDALRVAEKAFSMTGILFFIGALATAAPIYLGRVLVGIGYSDEILGLYSFLGLLTSTVLTILGTFDQIIGPKFVKSERNNESIISRFQYFKKMIFINILIIFLTCALFFSIIFIDEFSYFKDKYKISGNVILPLILYCIFQVTSTVDWFLQAHDREASVAIAAVVQMVIFLVFCIVVITFGMPLVWVFWAHAIAKGSQLLIQYVTLPSRKSAV